MVHSEAQAGGDLIDPAGPGRSRDGPGGDGDPGRPLHLSAPPGSSGQVAVYSEYAHMCTIIRQILLQMKRWQNFVFIEGH
jgi:hypothetical protein